MNCRKIFSADGMGCFTDFCPTKPSVWRRNCAVEAKEVKAD
jgi:hypothetical protein